MEKESGRHYISLNQLTFVLFLFYKLQTVKWSDFQMTLKNGFGNCSSVFFVVVVLLANG